MNPRARHPSVFSIRRLIGPHGPSAGQGMPPIEALLEDMERRWLAGERPLAEDYGDWVDEDGAIDLIYREFCIREALDERPNPTEYQARFPRLADRLRSLFAVHGAYETVREEGGREQEPCPPRPLQAGDFLGSYSLIRELGRGQFASVFLAAQSDMEDRLVVVKVSRRPSLEPRLLAKAQHRHVVEVLSSGKTLDDQFYWVCLPFRGGATLADILAEWRSRKARPATGREFLDLLDAVASPEYPALRMSRAARELIGAGSHAQGMAWMVARLAEALDHAFRRGITHEDVKPSNILVTADGDPMLLDFSLGLGLQAPGDATRGEWGSPHYMAPERLRAFAEGQKGVPPRPLENHRSDIYALGLVLAEMIGGRPPVGPPGVADLPWEVAAELARERESESDVWRRLKDIPLGLRPILARCLAPDPNDRYRAAIHLAEDLDRWRNDRPLVHCNARSPILPIFRWARKRKAALAGAALFLSAGLLASGVVLRIRDGTEAQAAWIKFGRLWERTDMIGHRYTLPGRWTPIEPDDPVVLARRRLDEYDVLGPGVWRARDDVRALDAPDREDLDAWIQEQALRFARGLEQRGGSRQDRVRALNGLEKVATGGASEPILRRIAVLRDDLDLPADPTRAEAQSPPWIAAYLRGVECEDARPREALRHYEQALSMNPLSWWTRLRLALIQIRLGEYRQAATHLEKCLDRYPNSAGLRLELSSCLMLQGRLDEALEQDNRAVDLDPDLAMAYHNRLFIRARLGQSADNRADLDRFESLAGFRHGFLGRDLRYELAEATAPPPASANREGATGDLLPDYLERGLLASPDDVGLLVKAGAMHRRAGDYARARSLMDRVLEIEPANLQAIYHRAIARGKLREAGAAQDMERVCRDPRLEELLAREPEAVELFLTLAAHEFKAGRVDRAITLAGRGIQLADRFGQARTQALLNYVLAQYYIRKRYSEEGKDKVQIETVVLHLNQAIRLAPDLRESYEVDPGFGYIRKEIDRRLDAEDPGP